MTVNLDDTAVDNGVFKFGVCGQGSEYPVGRVRIDPSAESLEDYKCFTQRCDLDSGTNELQVADEIYGTMLL
jgi:hypothetical protein